MPLPITRQQAIELLKSFNPEPSEMNHYLESEAIMKAVGKHLNQDEEYYAMLGLLHDVDWTQTKNNPSEHISLAPQILKDQGFDQEFIDTIVSHVFGYKEIPSHTNDLRANPIEHALAASETLTGLIHSYALMRGKRVSDMEVKGLNKKFKDKKFAENCSREIIKEIENCGIELPGFFTIAIKAISEIKEEVGLE
ncbi:MAG: HDIG domain-containing protein [Nanoarchaeota archaeon]|jgi:putative nucleotidyltransferase with HDIG domain|nr:HDIG domain-containing protein [Nanoarchaeota archaeon]